MSLKLSLIIAAACAFPVAAFADATLYGRANVTVQQNSEGTKPSYQALESNASRIGLKGSEKLINEGIEMIYQAEYEAAFDDGQNEDGNKSSTLYQRNIFVGVKTDYGSLVGGNFDTPLRKVQNKVDLFNDLRGDIKGAISSNEKRMSNSIMYTSNKVGGFTGYLDVITSDAASLDNAASLAGSYELGNFYAAVAYDHNVRSLSAKIPNDTGTSALRLVGQYTVAGFQFGLLIDRDTNEEIAANADTKTLANAATETTGMMLSTQYTMGKVALKVQVGKSGNVSKRRDAMAFSVGADYNFSKNSKVFGFYSSESADALAATTADGLAEFAKQDELDNTYAGVGLEMNF